MSHEAGGDPAAAGRVVVGVIGRFTAGLARASLEPVLVRAGVFAAGLVALLVAAPPGLPGPLLAGAAVLAALPALAPRGRWVTVVVVATVAGWVAGAERWLPAPDPGRPEPPDPGGILLLAAALYLLHSLAALAATLPYDAVVAPEVVTRWLLRACAVVVGATLLSAAVLAGVGRLLSGPERLPDGSGLVAVTVAGLAVAVGLAAVLRSRARR